MEMIVFIVSLAAMAVVGAVVIGMPSGFIDKKSIPDHRTRKENRKINKERAKEFIQSFRSRSGDYASESLDPD